jgi:hypothetical protein
MNIYGAHEFYLNLIFSTTYVNVTHAYIEETMLGGDCADDVHE